MKRFKMLFAGAKPPVPLEAGVTCQADFPAPAFLSAEESSDFDMFETFVRGSVSGRCIVRPSTNRGSLARLKPSAADSDADTARPAHPPTTELGKAAGGALCQPPSGSCLYRRSGYASSPSLPDYRDEAAEGQREIRYKDNETGRGNRHVASPPLPQRPNYRLQDLLLPAACASAPGPHTGPVLNDTLDTDCRSNSADYQVTPCDSVTLVSSSAAPQLKPAQAAPTIPRSSISWAGRAARRSLEVGPGASRHGVSSLAIETCERHSALGPGPGARTPPALPPLLPASRVEKLRGAGEAGRTSTTSLGLGAVGPQRTTPCQHVRVQPRADNAAVLLAALPPRADLPPCSAARGEAGVGGWSNKPQAVPRASGHPGVAPPPTASQSAPGITIRRRGSCSAVLPDVSQAGLDGNWLLPVPVSQPESGGRSSVPKARWGPSVDALQAVVARPAARLAPLSGSIEHVLSAELGAQQPGWHQHEQQQQLLRE
ncbi:hypothetical protein V8C86DRAFT_2997564, partial [Haematococcus lacustris]